MNTHVFQKMFSRRMQRRHDKIDVFRGFANFEEQSNLSRGDKVSRLYRSNFRVQDYTRGSSITIDDVTDTEETLSVDQEKVIGFYIDDFDALQSNYRLQAEYSSDATVQLGNRIDGTVLAEVANANDSIDDGDIGGTNGNGITLTTSNIQKVIAAAARKLNLQNVGMDMRFGAVSPHFHDTLIQYIGGKDTDDADMVNKNGQFMKYYGFDFMMSNATYWTGILNFETNPTDGDTVTINGVTFTFKATLGSTAGNVHICSTAAKTLDQLVSAINTPGTSVAEATDAGFVALSQANQDKLERVTAVDGGTELQVSAKGLGYVVVSETLTDASDVWTPAKQIQHLLLGRKKCIDVVIQSQPKVQVKDVSDKLGKNILASTLFGTKTFAEGAVEMVDVQLRSDAY